MIQEFTNFTGSYQIFKYSIKSFSSYNQMNWYAILGIYTSMQNCNARLQMSNDVKQIVLVQPQI